MQLRKRVGEKGHHSIHSTSILRNIHLMQKDHCLAGKNLDPLDPDRLEAWKLLKRIGT
jgi:hypothetical protein